MVLSANNNNPTTETTLIKHCVRSTITHVIASAYIAVSIILRSLINLCFVEVCLHIEYGVRYTRRYSITSNYMELRLYSNDDAVSPFFVFVL